MPFFRRQLLLAVLTTVLVVQPLGAFAQPSSGGNRSWRFPCIKAWHSLARSYYYPRLSIARSGPFHSIWRSEEAFFANIEPFQRVVFLADGAWTEMAIETARKFPGKRIIGTDSKIEMGSPPEYFAPEVRAFYRGTGSLPDSLAPDQRSYHQKVRQRTQSFLKGRDSLKNLETREVDITRPLPLHDNEVDLVFMQRGLCLCHPDVQKGRCCAGIIMEKEAIRQFLGEVMRVLDKSKAGSTAFLHGQTIQPDHVPLWLQAARELSESHSFQLDWVEDGKNIVGLRLTSRGP